MHLKYGIFALVIGSVTASPTISDGDTMAVISRFHFRLIVQKRQTGFVGTIVVYTGLSNLCSGLQFSTLTFDGSNAFECFGVENKTSGENLVINSLAVAPNDPNASWTVDLFFQPNCAGNSASPDNGVGGTCDVVVGGDPVLSVKISGY
jgi:hypothetical protein